MKLVTYERDGRQHLATVVDGRVIDIALGMAQSRHPMLDFLAGGAVSLDAAKAQLAEAQRHWRADAYPLLDRVKLLAPIPRPGKIVAIGRNYADHAAETGVKPFERPRIISKLPSSVVGPGAVVRRPLDVIKLDYEIELAVVIGKRTKLVPRAQALEAVAGYTILNDVSAREFQFDVSPAQTTFAKSMDDFCPMGPWIVTADEVKDWANLDVTTRVNGVVKQSSNTKYMHFKVPRIIAELSAGLTLEPGDIISTGTPSGVGHARTPPEFMKAGDVLETEVVGLGLLRNKIGG
jgi:2,4-didehydro-3-deoxy-L-rhamnonate hydrolase